MPPHEDLPICWPVSLLPYLSLNILRETNKNRLGNRDGEKESKVERSLNNITGVVIRDDGAKVFRREKWHSAKTRNKRGNVSLENYSRLSQFN